MIGGVYLAYPIDQRGPASLDYLFQQIELFKRTLIESGTCKWVFDPGDAFRVNPRAETDDSLPRINRAAANNADVVVAFLPRGVASIGVPMEIDRAHGQGKHVMVLTDIDESWMLNLPRLWKVAGWEDEAIEFAVEWIANIEPPEQTNQHDDLRVKIDVEGCMPKRTYDDDAGLDLIVSQDVHIAQGGFADVPCGVSVELPAHTWGLVTGRSSAFRRRGLLVLPGVIDAGYRGPLFAAAFAQQHDVDLRAGERIAQLIVINNATRHVTPVQVEQLSPSMRGTNGFGSSGA